MGAHAPKAKRTSNAQPNPTYLRGTRCSNPSTANHKVRTESARNTKHVVSGQKSVPLESSTNPMAAAAALSSSIPSDNPSARRNNHTSNREHPPINHRSALRRSRAAADRISRGPGRADRAAHLSRARRVDPASSPPSRPRGIRERGGVS